MRIRNIFLYFFSRQECFGHSCAYVAHFVSERDVLYSNPESWRSKQPRYQLRHPYSCRRLSPFRIITYFLCIDSSKDFLNIFFCGLECVGHSCAYVAHYVFVSLDSNLASWRSKQLRHQFSHPDPYSHPSSFRIMTSVYFIFMYRLLITYYF
jgi:hypothetical protein